jgi:hypothetical protein
MTTGEEGLQALVHDCGVRAAVQTLVRLHLALDQIEERAAELTTSSGEVTTAMVSRARPRGASTRSDDQRGSRIERRGGSSRSSACGSRRARAIVTRRFSPPTVAPAVEQPRVQADLGQRLTQPVRGSSGTPALGSRLSRTVPSNMTGVCNTSAARRRSSRGSQSVIARPSKRTVPPVGSSSRFRQRRSEDLPEPDGPTSVSAPPRSMSTVTSLRIVAAACPRRPGYARERCST